MDVSTALRPFLDQVWADRDRLTERVARLITAELATYAVTPSSEVWIGMNRIFERSVTGDPFAGPTEEDRQAAVATGIQGGRGGISTEDLVAAVLIGVREVGDEVMARAAAAGIDAEVRLEGTRRSFAWAQQVALWAAQGLAQGAAGAAAEEREAVNRLVAALRHGAPADEVQALASGLGLDLAAPWYAVYVRAPRGAEDSGVEAAALAFRLTQRGGTVWIEDGPATIGLVTAPPTSAERVIIGVAGPAPLADLGPALVEADRAGRVARALAGPGVHTLETLGLLVPLHEDPVLLERLRRRWLAPLAGGPRHDLVATLRSWQRYGGQVDPVARELLVHANTVRNRLSRIDSLLGPDWRLPRQQAEIWAAIVGSTQHE
jgi:hypothetical protein